MHYFPTLLTAYKDLLGSDSEAYAVCSNMCSGEVFGLDLVSVVIFMVKLQLSRNKNTTTADWTHSGPHLLNDFSLMQFSCSSGR